MIGEGYVHWFSPTRHYGFIRTRNGDAIFNERALRAAGLDRAPIGARVVFRDGPASGPSLRASEIISIDESTAENGHPISTLVGVRCIVKLVNEARHLAMLSAGPRTPDILLWEMTAKRTACWPLVTGQIIKAWIEEGDQGYRAGRVERWRMA